jgi:hypothetical protein
MLLLYLHILLGKLGFGFAEAVGEEIVLEQFAECFILD